MADPLPATDETIRAAAAIIRTGGLVAFPTETVYGLGADALNTDAVASIFDAKGRPATNPVIVHVASIKMLHRVAFADPRAPRLADAFWPGPLTLVLPRRDVVPDIVTAGGPTVGVRMPRHPVALALIREAGTPIAAPSANRSEQLSPTLAEHVAAQLGDRVDIILDGGPTEVGLESTVLDLTTNPVRILRPGMLCAAEIAAVLGEAVADPVAVDAADHVARSPGQMARHYAPRTPLRIVDDPWAERHPGTSAILGWDQARQGETTIVLPADPAGYAAGLYAALHRLDSLGCHRIVVQSPPTNDAGWIAVWDRLRRAQAP